MNPDTKPALQSVTVLGSGFVVLTWALPLILHALGVKNSQDVSDIVQLVHQAGPVIGAAVAIYGRMRARTTIAGVITSPQPVNPADDPPY